MKEQLLQAWNLHNQKNLLVLSNIEASFLGICISGRGRTIGDQLAHMHNVRMNWTEQVAKPLYQKTILLGKDAELTMPVLTDAFHTSAGIIAEVINSGWENGGKLPSFKSGLIPFVSYLISHESHHRGNLLLTLKQAGHKIPEKLKWGLWEW